MESLVARGNEFNLDPITPPTFEERSESATLNTMYIALSRSLEAKTLDNAMQCICGQDRLASPNYESSVGHMVFHLACAKGDLTTAQLAMQHCLWTQSNRFGTTGLMEAARHGHLDVVLHLVSHGGDLNQRDLKGRNAFAMLYDGGHHDMMQYLLKFKAKPTSHDNLLQWWHLDAPSCCLGLSSALPKAPSPLKNPFLQPIIPPPSVQPRPSCAQCQARHASKQCHSCEVAFCDQCYWRFHIDSKRRHHEYHVLCPTAQHAADTCAGYAGWSNLHLLLTGKPRVNSNQELRAIQTQKHKEDEKEHIESIKEQASVAHATVGMIRRES
jgi:hypothetical protein